MLIYTFYCFKSWIALLILPAYTYNIYTEMPTLKKFHQKKTSFISGVLDLSSGVKSLYFRSFFRNPYNSKLLHTTSFFFSFAIVIDLIFVFVTTIAPLQNFKFNLSEQFTDNFHF